MGSVSTKAKTLDADVSDLEKGVSSLSSDLSKMDTAMQNGFSTGNAVLRFKQQIDDAEDKLGELEQQMKSFAAQRIPTDEFQLLTAESQKLNAEMSRLLARQDRLEGLGVSHTAKQWQNLSKDIARVNALMDQNQKARFTMEREGTAYVSGTDTAQYQQMNSQLDQIRVKLSQNKALIDAEAIAQAQLNVQVAQEAVTAAKTTAKRQQALERLRTAQAELNALAAQSSAKAAAPNAAAVSGWQKFKNIMASVAKTALQTSAAIAKVSLKTLAVGAKASYTALKSLGKALKNLIGFLGKAVTKIKAFNKHSRSMGRYSSGLTSIFSNFKMMLGFSLISTAISSITKAVSESIGMLARYSEEFDSALSNIMNSVKALAGNITVTLSNALIAIEPVLTQIIDAVSQAFTYLNALFSQLQGETTVTVAKKQTDSYAESLEDAAESAEKLKNQVYGFDELNKRSGQDTSSTEKEKQPEDLFEEVPIDSIIPEELLNVFDKIKEAIENGDWYGLGQMAAEGLNNLLKTIDDWINNVFRPKGVEWARNIAELFNGLVDGLDWTLLGKTIADGLNAIADIINTFLTTFNFENLGNGFGEAINGFFGNVELDLIGQTFANGFNALIDFIFGLVNTVDWSLIGDSFAEFFNNFFFTVDWEKGTQTITTGLNGIIEAFQHFLDGVDWDAVGETIGSAADSLINGTDWNNLGTTIGTGLQSIIDVYNTFMREVDFNALGENISSAFNHLMDNVNFSEMGAAFAQKWEALIETLHGVVTTANWSEIGNSIAGFINGWFNEIDWQVLAETVSTGINGIFDALQNTVDTLGWTEIATQITDSLNSAVADIDWTGAGEAAGNGVIAIFDFAAKAIENIEWQDLGNSIADFLAGINWSGIFTSISEGIGAALGGLEAFLVGLIEDAMNSLVEWWYDVAYEDGEFCITGLLEGILNVFKDIGTWIKENIFKPFTDGFKAAFGIHSPSTEMQTMGEYVIEGLLAGITGTWTSITSFFDEKLTALKESMSQKWDEIKSTVSKTWENIKSDTSSKWNSITSTLSSSWDKLKTTASSKFNELKTTVTQKWNDLKNTLKQTDWSSIGSNLVSGLQRGISNAWNTLTSTVSSLARSVTSTHSSIFGINSPSKVWAEIGEYLDAGLVEGIKDGTKSILTTTSNLAKSVNSSMKLESPEFSATRSTSSIMNGIDALAIRFDGFINSLKSVADVLSSAGTLTVPSVAAGTAIPYKIKANALGGSDAAVGLSDGLQTSMTDQTDLLSEVDYKLGQLIELVKNKHLVIDADALERSVTYRQRNREREYGAPV